MTIHINSKTFKSGNSTAVRLPKALGIEPDTQIQIIKDDKGIHIVELAKNIDLTGIVGCAPDMRPVRPEDRPLLKQPRAWDEPDEF
jgi:antitoxin VapB|tara:strand:+ start:135072 stop:135329 length:258 start_codon:yes stop_codon:yes gene_type:complete